MKDRNKNTLYCANCGSPNLRYYDGLLGYESIVCGNCETHHNDNYPLITKTQAEAIYKKVCEVEP